MASLSYRHGAMNSSKSANLLMVAYNYEAQGRRVLCLKPAVDTRVLNDENTGKGVIESRALPYSHDCELVDSSINLFKFIKEYNNLIILQYVKGLSAVLVDEAQFLSPEQVKQLADVVENLNIDVICFGLKNSFVAGKIFDGASALLYYADSIMEIDTPCKYCDKKATMNLRIVNGVAVYSGDVVAVGDVGDVDISNSANSEVYAQVCYHHYLNPPAPIIRGKAKSLTVRNVNDTLIHILNYNNAKGFYKKSADIKKEDLICVDVNDSFDNNSIVNLKYITVGAIAINIEDFCKDRENSQVNRVNGTAITKAIIDFVYDFYESDLNKAYNLLKDSARTYVEFFDSETDYKNFVENGANENKCHKLRDNHWYYLDFHTNAVSRFWRNVLLGMVDNLDIDIKYYFCGPIV